MSAIPYLLPNALVDTVALECGIRPLGEVLSALRADGWLHGYGDPVASDGRAIKKAIRDAFHADDPGWQGMALGQGLATCRAAVSGLQGF